MKASTRLGVLLSGRGSNFLAIHESIVRGDIPAQIALVLSDRQAALGLERARQLGYRAEAVPVLPGGSREAHEEELLAHLRDAAVQWVCLAGYMRLLSGRLVSAYRERIVNIHPSLLPAFPGLGAQRQALEHGVRVAGCTVHLVDEGLDSGPIVTQYSVPVLDDDDEESLTHRILATEHQAYPEALRRLLTEAWRVEGRRLVFSAA